MSELQSRRMEGGGEVLATNVLGFALGARRPNPYSEIVSSHTKQIASLRREIEERNEALSRFNKDLKDLREQNDELKITVESKDEEIKALKEKINKLESEKKALETNLRSVVGELEAVRKEVVELKEANTTSEEKNVALEMNVKKLSKKMDGMTKDLEESKTENSTLKKEVKDLREEVQSVASFGLPERMSTLPVEKASLVLGELCWRVQAMMYQKVFPNSYDSRKSYKVKHIEEDIEELEDGRQKDEARKRWDALKKKLNWKKTKHTRAMKSIQDNRNDTAHPDLDEKLVVSSAKLMEQEGKLTGWHSAACVDELIEMWKQLVQPQ